MAKLSIRHVGREWPTPQRTAAAADNLNNRFVFNLYQLGNASLGARASCPQPAHLATWPQNKFTLNSKKPVLGRGRQLSWMLWQSKQKRQGTNL